METPIEQAYRYCPQCGAAADSVGEVPFRCRQCEFTAFFGPVTAVGAILSDPQGRLLLIRRARDPGRGLFGLPGGFVDRGETAQQAAQREIREEVGLDVDAFEYLTTIPNEYTYRGLTASVLDIFFTARVESFDRIDHDQHEVAGCWIGTPGDEQLNHMAFESNRRALLTYLG